MTSHSPGTTSRTRRCRLAITPRTSPLSGPAATTPAPTRTSGARCSRATPARASADLLARRLDQAGRHVLAALASGPVGPAIARLARRAKVDVDELAGRIDADAERALVLDTDVERLREVVELADRHALDPD